MKVKTIWTIRRSTCGKELKSEDVVSGFRSYEAALGRLRWIAASIGTQTTKDEKGCDIISLAEDDDHVIYWIYGETGSLTSTKKPNLFSKPCSH